MEDANTDIQSLKDRILDFARERDWEQFHSPKNLSMAIATEAAELMEHFLWQTAESSRKEVLTEPLREKITEEIADILIFAIEFANVAEIDIASAICKKMEKNAEKYPVSKAKGRSEKYTDL